MTETDPDVVRARAVAAQYEAGQHQRLMAFVQRAVQAEHGIEAGETAWSGAELHVVTLEALLTTAIRAAATFEQRSNGVDRAAATSDPVERVKLASAGAAESEGSRYAYAVVRWTALQELLASGKTIEEIAELTGLSQGVALGAALQPPIFGAA